MRWLVPLVALLAEACGAPRMPTPKLAAHPTSALHEVPYPPPPARVESIPERPNDASVWVDGEWVWQGGRWSWRRGRWVVPAPDTAFAPWTHVRDARGTLYVAEGTWRAADGGEVDEPAPGAQAKPNRGPVVNAEGEDVPPSPISRQRANEDAGADAADGASMEAP